MKIQNIFKKSFIIFISSFFLIGCGYHMMGTAAKDTPFHNVKSIEMPVFKNTTQRSEIEIPLTNAFVKEFSQTYEIKYSNADVTINGAVTKFDLKPISLTAAGVVSSYRLFIKLSVTVIENKSGKIIWHDNNITDFEDFIVDRNNVTITEEREFRSFEKMAPDLARLIKERIVEGF